jgi:predicted ATPase
MKKSTKAIIGLSAIFIFTLIAYKSYARRLDGISEYIQPKEMRENAEQVQNETQNSEIKDNHGWYSQEEQPKDRNPASNKKSKTTEDQNLLKDTQDKIEKLYE